MNISTNNLVNKSPSSLNRRNSLGLNVNNSINNNNYTVVYRRRNSAVFANQTLEYDLDQLLYNGVKAVLFDFDNTIANTTLQHYEAWCEACNQNQFNFFSFKDYYEKYNGYNSQKTLEVLSNLKNLHLTKEQISLISQQKSQNFEKHLQKIQPFSEAISIINKCKNKAVYMAIASGSSQKEIITILQNGKFLEIQNLFDEENIVGQKMYNESKPKPDPYMKAKEVIEYKYNTTLSNKECLVIEDALVGIMSGLRNSKNTKIDIMKTFNIHQYLDKNKNFINNLMQQGEIIANQYLIKNPTQITRINNFLVDFDYNLDFENLTVEKQQTSPAEFNRHKHYLENSILAMEKLNLKPQSISYIASSKYHFLSQALDKLNKSLSANGYTNQAANNFSQIVECHISLLKKVQQKNIKELINLYKLTTNLPIARQKTEGLFEGWAFPKEILFKPDLKKLIFDYKSSYFSSTNFLYVLDGNGRLNMIVRDINTNHDEVGSYYPAVMAGDIKICNNLKYIKVNNQSGSYQCTDIKSYIFTIRLLISLGFVDLAQNKNLNVKFIYSFKDEEHTQNCHVDLTSAFSQITPSDALQQMESINNLSVNLKKIINQNKSDFEKFKQNIITAINTYNHSYKNLNNAFTVTGRDVLFLFKLVSNLFEKTSYNLELATSKINNTEMQKLKQLITEKTTTSAQVRYLKMFICATLDLHNALDKLEQFTLKKCVITGRPAHIAINLPKTLKEGTEWAHFSS